MNRYYDSQFGKNIVTIYPGEYFTSFGEEYISTVLGSCVSVALYDENLQVGGLNHFMLAYDGKGDRDKDEAAVRFGEYAMELLINDLLKKGASRQRLTAKVFGGSNVLGSGTSSKLQVGENNIKFVFEYLKSEKIPVVSSNTGGDKPRKIFYDPKSSKIWLKHIKNSTMRNEETLNKREKEYASRVRENEKHAGDIVWF